MRVNHFLLYLTLILLTALVLSVAWEFWLEDFVLNRWLHLQAPEATLERWEYVVSVMTFVSIAMIYPAIAGYRLIVRHQRMMDEIRRHAQEDYLTGIANRRKTAELIATEIRRCERYGGPLSVILMDIDRFKEINDTYGHDAGDRALKTTADLLRQMIRNSDTAGRWGGEEFLVVCPQTDLEGAKALAEKLRRVYANTEFPTPFPKSASFGVACYQAGDSVDGLVARADAALYEAKAKGRDRVVLTR